MKNPPSFQFYPADFLVDTAGMDAKEVGAYWRLACYCWIHDGLPDDDNELKRLAGVGRGWKKMRARIRSLFVPVRTPNSEVSLHHKRLIQERDKQRKHHEQRVLAGKESARKRNKRTNARSTTVEVSLQRSSPSSSSSSYPPHPTPPQRRGREENHEEQKSPPAPVCRSDPEAFGEKHYQVEVLNKCEGRLLDAEHPAAATLFLIGKHVPKEIISNALALMQDARLNNLNPDRTPVHNLTRLYLGTVRRMCEEEGIETPINWKPGGPVSSMDPDEIENQDTEVGV